MASMVTLTMALTELEGYQHAVCSRREKPFRKSWTFAKYTVNLIAVNNNICMLNIHSLLVDLRPVVQEANRHKEASGPGTQHT